MKKSIFLLFGLLALLIIGCSSDDDNGTTPEEPPPPPARVIVDTTATAPTMSAVDEATWNNVDSTLITIGAYPTVYGKDAVLGQQDVVMKAIRKSDTLYIKVKWNDRIVNLWGDYLRKTETLRRWELVNSTGQDIFSIILNVPDTSVDSGAVDVWRWMSTKTAAGRMAEDYWMAISDDTAISDSYLNYTVYRENDLYYYEPTAMHSDSSDYTGQYLFLEDTVAFRFGYPVDFWPTNYKMPGYVIDTNIFNLPTRDLQSRWDVRAISHFDSVQATYPNYTWTIVFERALNTGHNSEDLDLSSLDSVKMSIIADNNSNAVYTKDSSGSAPFWLILKP